MRLAAEGRVGIVGIAYGYDRYSSADFRGVDCESFYTVGPNLRIQLSDSMFLTLRAGFGNVNSFSIAIGGRF